MVLPFRTASCRSSPSCSAYLRASNVRSILKRSMAKLSTWFSCCWRRRAPAQIISRRWPASPGCCGTLTSRTSCVIPATSRHSIPYSRCHQLARLSLYCLLVRQTRCCSVHADRLELLAPGVGDCGLAAVSQHDWRAVGGVQRIEQRAGRELGRLRELLLHVLGSDCPDIGDATTAKHGECFGRDAAKGDVGVAVRVVVGVHGPRLLSTCYRSSPGCVEFSRGR